MLSFVLQLDERDWKAISQATAIAVGNAKYFGGGMKITPGASPSSGEFEVMSFPLLPPPQGTNSVLFLLVHHISLMGSQCELKTQQKIIVCHNQIIVSILRLETNQEEGLDTSPQLFL